MISEEITKLEKPFEQQEMIAKMLKDRANFPREIVLLFT
jgi:hypothetical protein